MATDLRVFLLVRVTVNAPLVRVKPTHFTRKQQPGHVLVLALMSMSGTSWSHTVHQEEFV